MPWISFDDVKNVHLHRLETRLSALEEFKQNRDSLEMTIEELKNLIQQKEQAYHRALTEMEIALIRFKDR